MKNKKLFKFGLMVFAVLCLGFSFTSATNFKLNVKMETDKVLGYALDISPIHFADNGNDFGGFMYFTNEESELKKEDDCNDVGGDKSGNRYDGDCNGDKEVFDEDEEDQMKYQFYLVSGADGKVMECKTRVKGFYYNAERGERLWPLDQETAGKWGEIMDLGGLETIGGIYTKCRDAGYHEKLCGCEDMTWDSDKGDCVCKDDDGDGNCDTIQESECSDEDESCIIKEINACKKNLQDDYPEKFENYGLVKHIYKGQEFGLVMGADYSIPNSTWSSLNIGGGDKIKLERTFVRLFNMAYFGFVYDYNGGLGLVGCEIKEDKKADSKTGFKKVLGVLKAGKEKDYFSFSQKVFEVNEGSDLAPYLNCSKIGISSNSLVKIIVEGLVGMNRESDLTQVGYQMDPKMQYFSAAGINNSTVLNYANGKSESLCRGKKWHIGEDDVNFEKEDVICFDLNGAKLEIDERYRGHTLIVKNGDVIISPETTESLGNEKVYDMFINGGNLLIKEDSDTPQFVFTTQGFIADKTIEQFISILEKETKDDKEYQGELAGVGSLLRGNFIVNGKIKGFNGELTNKYFIHGKLTTKDSFSDLEGTFIWRCGNGYVTDKYGEITEAEAMKKGIYCPPSTYITVNEKKVYDWYNPYEGAALVVIDQNYTSPLYW